MVRHELLKSRRSRVLLAGTGATAILATLIAVSGYRAKKACDGLMSKMSDATPYYSTRLALHPNQHMSSNNALGSNPGWVVTYANQMGSSAVAFYVSFLGQVEAMVTPLSVPQVINHEENLRTALDAFNRKFAALDRAVPLGMTYADALGVLGPPLDPSTNDGSIHAVWIYEPPGFRRESITNGVFAAVLEQCACPQRLRVSIGPSCN